MIVNMLVQLEEVAWYQLTFHKATGRYTVEVCVEDKTKTVSSRNLSRALDYALQAVEELRGEASTQPNRTID